ncbi:MAG: hypothetical protein NC918_08850, partial [Candidatus Omnitrophica bacterium]|nr:hypothetical protein [Candidatus Omnitrophota bacterium]
MSLYSFSMLISSLFAFFTGLFVYFKNRYALINKIFLFLNFLLSIWVFGCFMESIVQSQEAALLWDIILYIGPILYIPTYLFFVYIALGIKKIKIIWLSYLLFSIFLLFNIIFPLRKFFILDVVKKYPFRFIAIPNFIWYIFFILFCCYAFYAFFLYLKNLTLSSGTQKLRVKYFFISYIVMAAAGLMYFLLLFNIKSPAIDPYLLILYNTITAYAIIKHRVMDIRVAVTKATLFIVVYFFILALPFYFGYLTKSWLITGLSMFMFAIIAPFIYNLLYRQTETILFKQQKKYQEGLRELSKKVLRIRDLNNLLSTIIDEVYKAVRPEFIALYTKVDNSYKLNNNYIPKDYPFQKEFPLNHILIETLNIQKIPLLVESIYPSNFLFETLSIPFFTENTLYAFLIIGPKPKKAYYLTSDLIIFDILSSQVSLALENCIFWED